MATNRRFALLGNAGGGGGGGSLDNVVEDTTPQLGGSLDVQGFNINTSVSNGDITISPNGTGDVIIGNYTFDGDQTVGAGQDNYVLTYDNATGLISLEAATGGGGGLTDVVDDTTPQLGGNLDVQTYAINTSAVNGDITLTPNGTGDVVMNGDIDMGANSITTTSTNQSITLAPSGTGNVVLGNYTLDGDQTVGASQDNYVLTYDDATGLVSLEALVGSISSGSVTGSSLRWDGAAWSENTSIRQTTGSLFLAEKAASEANVAGFGQLWVNTDTPNKLWFQQDDGNDVEVAVVGDTDYNDNYFYVWRSAAGNPPLYARQANTSGPYALFFQNGFADATSGTQYVELGPNGIIEQTGVLYQKERGTATTDQAGFGQLWVRSDTPNTLMWTDDAGTDYVVSGSASTALSNIVEDTTPQLGGNLDANGNVIDMGTYLITDVKVGQWDQAYDNTIASASFATGTGVLTLTQNDSGTVTVDLDGRYTETGHAHIPSDITGLDGHFGYGDTTPSVGSNYNYNYRTHASSPVLYARQASTGDICRFFQNASAGATSGTSQVTIRNDGGITVTAEITQSGEGSFLYHGSSSYGSGSITVQSGGSPTGGSNGDVYFIY